MKILYSNSSDQLHWALLYLFTILLSSSSLFGKPFLKNNIQNNSNLDSVFNGTVF